MQQSITAFGLSAVLALSLALPTAAAVAQTSSAAPPPIAAPLEPPGAIVLPLPAGTPPGSKETERWIAYQGQARLMGVTLPTLTPFLPAPGKATGAAVIVAPGGGFVQLALEKEGWNVARWLADHGVAAFVLKYRLIPMGQRRGAANPMAARPAPPPAGQPVRLQTYATGGEDARAAIRLLRERAGEWGVDPRRIGVMGFSAGATLALSLAIEPDASMRPNFIVPIYAPAGKIEIPADAPPMFAAIAADDGLFAQHGIGLVQAWTEAKRPVEFHLYEKGGHGFGVPGVAGTTTTGLMDQLLLWLKSRGLLERAEQPTTTLPLIP